MERRIRKLGAIYIEELWFSNPYGAVRGGISFMGTDLIYNPVDRTVVQGHIDGADWMFSVLDQHECQVADRVIEATMGTIAYNSKGAQDG